MDGDAGELQRLVRRADEGDREALGELFARHRERLVRMVQVRLDRRLRGRIDASDVIQETHLEALRRFEDYRKDRRMPFFLWLRFLTQQKLAQLHRHHLKVQGRDARREVRLQRGPGTRATSAQIAWQLMGKRTTPSGAAARAELRFRLEAALNSMDPMDCEVLALRHFEQLTNAETATELGIEESAASKRYIRALKKLESILHTTEEPG